MQRLPPGFEAFLQSFEQWLLERLHRQPGLLEQIHLTFQYSAREDPILWLVEFKREIADQIAGMWEASADPLSLDLLDELLTNDYFWNQYVEEWLLARPLALCPAPVEFRRVPGKFAHFHLRHNRRRPWKNMGVGACC